MDAHRNRTSTSNVSTNGQNCNSSTITTNENDCKFVVTPTNQDTFMSQQQLQHPHPQDQEQQMSQHQQQSSSTMANGSEMVDESKTHASDCNQMVVTAPERSSSLTNSAISSAGNASEIEGIVKSPNSYKYPLLKKYYEFGPWVGRNRKAICLSCRVQTCSSQPDRLLRHLSKCSALTEADKVLVADLMNDRTANKRKRPDPKSRTPPSHRRDISDGDSEYYGENDNNDDLNLSSLNSCSLNLPTSINNTSGGTKNKHKRENDSHTHIDEALTRFIISCRIPLKAIHSHEFVEFCRALNPDYHLPSRETITNVLIPGMLNII